MGVIQKIHKDIYKFMDENHGKMPTKLVVRKDVVNQIIAELGSMMRPPSETEKKLMEEGAGFFQSFAGIRMETVEQSRLTGIYVPKWVMELDDV